jgi:hypothetical protein
MLVTMTKARKRPRQGHAECRSLIPSSTQKPKTQQVGTSTKII